MNIKTFIKRYLKRILLFLCLIGLMVIIYFLFKNKLSAVDKLLYSFISKFKSPILTSFFKFITFFASIEWFIIVGLFLLFFYDDKKIKIIIPIYVIGISLITLLMKNIFVRVRPIELMIIKETGYSFPSGHSSSSIAFYGLLAYLVYKSNLKKWKKISLISLLLLLSLLIGISRIYLGVHYSTDVLAGFMVGIIYFVVFIYVYDFERSLK